MHNLYQVLGLTADAHPAAIAAAIEAASATVEARQLEQASLWLLDAARRARYDAYLRELEPQFFMTSSDGALMTTPLTPSSSLQTADVQDMPAAATISSPPFDVHRRHRRELATIGLIIALLCGLLAGLAWWTYGLWGGGLAWQPSGIRQLNTSSGWHHSADGVYAVAQNQPPVLLLLVDGVNEVVPVLLADPKRVALPCHQNGAGRCRLGVTFKQRPEKIFHALQIDGKLLLDNEAERREWVLLLQDAAVMQMRFMDYPNQPELVFQLGEFPSAVLVRTAESASTAHTLTPMQQQVEHVLSQIDAAAASSVQGR